MVNSSPCQEPVDGSAHYGGDVLVRPRLADLVDSLRQIARRHGVADEGIADLYVSAYLRPSLVREHAVSRVLVREGQVLAVGQMEDPCARAVTELRSRSEFVCAVVDRGGVREDSDDKSPDEDTCEDVPPRCFHAPHVIYLTFIWVMDEDRMSWETSTRGSP